MMLLDTVIYLLLTWYIEAVFPGESFLHSASAAAAAAEDDDSFIHAVVVTIMIMMMMVMLTVHL